MNPPNADIRCIIIFQKPELYFFPRYGGQVFAPFCIPERGLRYLLYKLFYVLRLPLRSLFWGEWKKHVPEAGQVIIFDYGYQRGMEKYIRHVNPRCRVAVFYWNRVGLYNKVPLRTMNPEDLYSTDPSDCRRYHMNYNHIFYPRELYTPPAAAMGGRLFFLGADKGRASYLLALKKAFEKEGLVCDIRMLPRRVSRFRRRSRQSYREEFAEILTGAPLSYAEYIKQLSGCDILLDINQAGQTALTMRVMEAIYLSKKLITNNRDIINYDFYNPRNIFLLPGDNALPSPEDIRLFLRQPFAPYPHEILEKYSFEHWLSGFCGVSLT